MAANIDEFARQRALDTYRVVDTIPEQAFDDITRLASMVCDAPIALVSLIDRDRQWFKSRTGLDLTEGKRDEAFCDHVIRQPDRLMEVPDATRDPRFADNPFVTGPDNIRFYAGMPLVTPGGAPIGTLCVLDRQPRELSGEQREGLAALARLTMNLMEARHREIDLQRANFLAGQTEGETATQPAAPAPPDPYANSYTVAIFEVQGITTAIERNGERAVARTLAQLHEALEARLRPGSGDSVNHATASPELVVVLRGKDTDEALTALAYYVADFQRETGLTVLLASAKSNEPSDSPNGVFLRADAELSQAKDLHRVGIRQRLSPRSPG